MEDLDFEILERYDTICKAGKGVYGIVYKAYDRKTHKIVALKKIYDAFRNQLDAQRTYREVVYLSYLNNHENIIKLKNIIKSENDRDLYLIFEYMETDLHLAIRSNILELIHKKYILYQVLRALKHLHSLNLIHRDIKPSNILMNDDCTVKLCDMGLIRSLDPNNKNVLPPLTESVGTLWYRSPEILLCSAKYGKESDIWGVGCLMAELIGGKPIFPGTSTINQLNRILEITGKPSKEDILNLQSEYASTLFESISGIKTKSLKNIYKHASGQELDLLSNLLNFNPIRRPSVDEALEHPFFSEFHKEKKHKQDDRIVKIPIPDYTKLQIKDYKEAIYDMINAKSKAEAIIKNQKDLAKKKKIKSNFLLEYEEKKDEQHNQISKTKTEVDFIDVINQIKKEKSEFQTKTDNIAKTNSDGFILFDPSKLKKSDNKVNTNDLLLLDENKLPQFNPKTHK